MLTLRLDWIVVLALSIAFLGCEAPDAPAVTEISQTNFLENPPADALVLDVRSPAEYAAGHVPGAVNIPHNQVPTRLSELHSELDRPIVVYCKSGTRAGLAASALLEAGYLDIRHLTGDMNEWLAAGLPTE